ncbi:carbohydrate ABC transporter permease [Halalkalibacterium halodurans]|jgi:multiple sugar transport system permease protein|uniref:Sugar transport system (Permease) (Binding protein dependent transporter) n=3 Tax=Halalkalibacterium halodurans TaxID=86665 RepID=Q9KBQ9_HALH5|nr:carbohydrate ABC transporter permease [Halalkalibacterium halodurans]MDY7222425.1 carbohydrate ABC transporter permease [Halalkalibacterium halodurans]MDY7241646.1 carbohydrate ABC transporter permease [Halalkalibacterium halodurans]MED4082267.1 carbohydrate ABC transporter permease [Halalkalibacterium halodurans]MED4083582.1 carbohydrate ABC transporter permease [Halalkalibacterium halodurans]MED4105895.1 carbohydrate ABC transporter permease [Halalkalibacterium halodurans]
MEAVSWYQSKSKMNTIKKILSYTFLMIGGLIMAVPFLWMLSTSLKTPGAIFAMPPEFIPREITFENYIRVFTEADLLLGFRNTMIIIIPTTAIGIFTSSLAAFAFAKLNFPGRDKLFFALIATMMLPGIVTLVPQFILFRELGWLDTFKPLMIPGFFGAAMTVFFLRQFFMTIPNDLIDAAKIDGLSFFGIFRKIMVPLAKPAIVTQVILGLLAGYNDFMGPLIYLNSPENFTLQLVLASFRGYYTSEWGLIMAGSVIALIPTLVAFFFAQKQFIEGIVMTGVKG